MRTRWMLAILLAAATPGTAALATATDDVATETQERLKRGGGDIDWANLIGLVGLFGLMGFRREHAEDSYHPASLE